MKARGKKRMLTAENNRAPKEIDCDLPAPIVDALMQGYDVYITKECKEGVISAKITFHKVKVAGRERLGTKKN